MRLTVIVAAALLFLSGTPCNASSGKIHPDDAERLRRIHTECERAYMKNDFYSMGTLLEESTAILDSLDKAGYGPEDLYEAYALYYKDFGSYYYCISDIDTSNSISAEACYLSALTAYEMYDDDPLKKAGIHSELAQLYYKLGLYMSALQYLERNLEIYEKGWDDAAFRTLSEIALCKARMGMFDEALDDIDLALDGGRIYDRSMEMVRKKGKILALRAEATDAGFKESARCFRKYFEAQRDSVATAFAGMSSAEREKYWLRMHPFITDCYRIGNEDACLLYDVTLFSKNILLQFSERRGSPVDLTWKDIQKRLGKGECAIEFICYESKGRQHMAALLLKRSGQPEFRYIAAVEDMLGISINGYVTVRDALESTNEDYKDYLYANTRIGSQIWGELTEDLKDMSKVYFAPDGIFHQIAIEYLYPESEEHSPAMHRLTGTRELARDRKATDCGKMLLCGGIDFSGMVENEDAKGYRNDRLAYHLIQDLHPYFTEIPGSREEVDTIFALRTNPDDRLLTGNSATEEQCSRLFNEYPVVMVSTHGYFGGSMKIRGNEIVPCTTDIRLSESVLIMSGAQTNLDNPFFDASQADGILSARELSGMDLGNVELFIASACQSGLGHVTSDGVYGLQRGLKNAGVKAMILSLWNVNDEATKFFMTNLNSALNKGEDLHSAFEYARSRMEDEIHYKEWKYNSGRMRGEYVDRHDAIYSLPRYRNAFILIDNI